MNKSLEAAVHRCARAVRGARHLVVDHHDRAVELAFARRAQHAFALSLYGSPRGSILASDGTVLAKSDPVNDAFSYQRSYANGAPLCAGHRYFSVTQNADRSIEASENDLLTGESECPVLATDQSRVHR